MYNKKLNERLYCTGQKIDFKKVYSTTNDVESFNHLRNSRGLLKAIFVQYIKFYF